MDMDLNEIERLEKYDVVICGGGPAGVAAAWSAAESGVRVLVLEHCGFLGGAATSGLPLLTFHDLSGNQVVRGFAQRFVDQLMEREGSPGHVPIRDAHMKTLTPVDPEVVKLVAQEMLLQKNVDVLFNCLIADVVRDGARITAVVVQTKYGRFLVEGECFLDATGDGDVVSLSGGPFTIGDQENYCQPMCLLFKLSGVDVDRVPESFGEELAISPSRTNGFERVIHATGTFTRWSKQIESTGILDGNPRHRVWIIANKTGEVVINTIKIFESLMSVRNSSAAEIEGRRQARLIADFFKRWIPGFEHSHISSTDCFVRRRESRRIVGKYVLTGDDIRSGTVFPDTIGLFGYPIDIHNPDGVDSRFDFVRGNRSYGIPYRILIPEGLDNLLVAGRIVSATSEALASIRVMVGSMITGQAAGTACRISLKAGHRRFTDVPSEDLREDLLKHEVLLDPTSI